MIMLLYPESDRVMLGCLDLTALDVGCRPKTSRGGVWDYLPDVCLLSSVVSASK